MSRILSVPLFLCVVASACSEPLTCLAGWEDTNWMATRPSPYDSVSLRVDTSMVVRLCYSRPSVRGRVVFGDLVPFDTLWRTGANEPTIIKLGQPADIAGIPVQPGSYSIYTVPREGDWSVVINASTSQWGLTRDEVGADGVQYYNAYTEEVRAQEVGRAPIEVREVPFVEQLTASFQPLGGSAYLLHFDWERTRIVVPLRLRDPNS